MVAARPLAFGLEGIGQSGTMCPALPQRRHSLLSIRRCLSSGLSLPSGPSRLAIVFLSEVVGAAVVAGFF